MTLADLIFTAFCMLMGKEGRDYEYYKVDPIFTSQVHRN